MGELAVVGVFAYPEIDAAAGGIGKALVNQAGYYLNDFWHLLGGAGIDVSLRLDDIQGFHIFLKTVGVLLGKLGGGNAALVGAVDNLVVDIGDVLHVLDPVIAEPEVAPDDIKDDIAHGVADVGVVVGGDAADVYLNLVLHL
ncbi:hypothetical protein ES708_03167 [subsurface metagenome]